MNLQTLCVLIVAAVGPTAPGVRESAAGQTGRPAERAAAEAVGNHVQSTFADLELKPWRVDPKGQVELRIEVKPLPGIHIYAPGQQGYVPVSLTFEPGDGVKGGRLDLPSPEPYVFEPTGERFLVYKQPFAAVQRATLGADAAAWRSGRIRATLRYQACDEAVCYKPETIALVWTRGADGAGQPRRKDP